MLNNENRFTKTVANYEAYRPHYPQEVLEVLIKECDLKGSDIIADIGSGTGILTELLLSNGNIVYGVEPNSAMRQVAETKFQKNSRFHSIKGSAENTTLDSHSIDLITAGTAFHWFEPLTTKIEFIRVLKEKGWVLLVWNVRDVHSSPLVSDYEDLLLTYCHSYKGSKAQTFEKTAVAGFFEPNKMITKSFPNYQTFDWQGLKGRLLSSSYCLDSDNPLYEAMLATLKKVFDRYQKNEYVEFRYETRLIYGQLTL